MKIKTDMKCAECGEEYKAGSSLKVVRLDTDPYCMCGGRLGRHISTLITLAEVKAQNKARGNYFFSRDSMRFFESRIHGGLRRGKYFITSEKNGPYQLMRLYTIRIVKENFDIGTVGEFQGYRSLDEAKEALKIMGVK